MPHSLILTPEKLLENLVRIFPDYAGEWETGEELSMHGVWRRFASISSGALGKASRSQLDSFGALVNRCVAARGAVENAVSTCFLEHGSQLGVYRILKPLLSSEAREELR